MFDITCRCCGAVALFRLRSFAFLTLSSASDTNSARSLSDESEAIREAATLFSAGWLVCVRSVKFIKSNTEENTPIYLLH